MRASAASDRILGVFILICTIVRLSRVVTRMECVSVSSGPVGTSRQGDENR